MRELVLAALVAFAGCSALGGAPAPSDDRALEVRNRTATALESVETYRLRQSIAVHADGDGETIDVRGSGTGSVNRTTHRMRMSTTVDGHSATSYVRGYTAYRACGGQWGGYVVENLSRSPGWFTHTPLGNQLDLLRETNVYWGGTPSVAGNRTDLIVAYPSKDTLLEFTQRRQRDSTDLREVDLKNATIKLWVDPETGRPVKSSVELVLGKHGTTATARTTMTYHGYNRPTEIRLPESVLDEENHRGFCPGS